MKHIKRSEAKAKGLKRFFTGKPCKRGHTAERQTAGGACCKCHTLKIKLRGPKDYSRFAEENPGNSIARTAFWRAKKLGLLCGCCKQSDFFPIYALANSLGHDVDHRHPKHLGGEHCLKNLQTLEPAAHREKTRGEQADANFERAMAKGKRDSISTPKRKRKAA